jgi:hypothetical protein
MPDSDWIAPSERVLFNLTHAKMIALDEFGTDVSGAHPSRRQRRILAETPRLAVTDHRLVFLNKRDQPTHETIYDLAYLRAFLPIVKRWNAAAEAKKTLAESGEGELERWFTSRSEERKFGVLASVDMLTWIERPKGLLGPKHYLLMTESSFRPSSAERQEAIEAEEARAQHVLERAKLKVEAAEIGPVFSYKPVQFLIHEKGSLDLLVSTVSPKMQGMADYVGRPEGLEADYGLPPQTTRGLAEYRPPDPETS